MPEKNFEKALAELEGIVLKLEEGEVQLNESLALFEKGVKLARFLRTELSKAEKKVEILLKNDEGELKAQPFETQDEKKESPEENNSDPDDNNSLPF